MGRKALQRLVLGLKKLEFSVSEFVTEVVPTVRSCLKELRRPHLKALHDQLDLNKTGSLSIRDAMAGLLHNGMAVSRRQYKDAYAICMAMWGRTTGHDWASEIFKDFEEFEEFTSIME